MTYPLHGSTRSAHTAARLLANRYRLGELLGTGGAADVYAAVDEALGRRVAVKVFRSNDDDPATARQRIEAEKLTLARLNEPGLVALYDAGVDDDERQLPVPFFVMELVDGPSLRHELNVHTISPAETALIGRELATTLAYVHSRGVIHRDIKPGNILLGPPRGHSGRYSTKLADFGIARLAGADRLTAHGSAVGTAHYLSPEQALGESLGPSSDIYSLGLVLIECLTGEMAFPGDPIPAAVARLRSDPPVPAEFGAAWQRVLTAMTDRKADARPSAKRVAALLADIETGTIDGAAILPVHPHRRRTSVLAAPQVTATTPLTPRQGKLRRPVGVTAVTLASLATVLGGVLISQHTPEAETFEPRAELERKGSATVEKSRVFAGETAEYTAPAETAPATSQPIIVPVAAEPEQAPESPAAAPPADDSAEPPGNPRGPGNNNGNGPGNGNGNANGPGNSNGARWRN
ncbi:serine/threonine protein kinase [Hoyosella sp. YIM 151337]|uniref:serine/threonine-protein kinase n=1 Tax=Hoyosella sp. YIM 151337 TaxID=2992742 RepID=UPI002236AE36|nr:serine/threonine-protein kinase [Hoyosella sp. YIM 151337]MCW4351733.1 serine/threonine protein kinase [Hoyosella sp. YIM 151337]